MATSEYIRYRSDYKYQLADKLILNDSFKIVVYTLCIGRIIVQFLSFDIEQGKRYFYDDCC